MLNIFYIIFISLFIFGCGSSGSEGDGWNNNLTFAPNFSQYFPSYMTRTTFEENFSCILT